MPPETARPRSVNPMGMFAVRASAVLAFGVAALLLRAAFWLASGIGDMPFALFFMGVVGALFVLPVAYLGVAAWGAWRLRKWGAVMLLVASGLVGLAALAIASQGSGDVALPLLLGAALVAAPLVLPRSWAALQ